MHAAPLKYKMQNYGSIWSSVNLCSGLCWHIQGKLLPTRLVMELPREYVYSLESARARGLKHLLRVCASVRQE